MGLPEQSCGQDTTTICDKIRFVSSKIFIMSSSGGLTTGGSIASAEAHAYVSLLDFAAGGPEDRVGPGKQDGLTVVPVHAGRRKLT
jgi:hypothetical protein